MKRFFPVFLSGTLFVLVSASVALAATLHVANNGADTAVCGTEAAPCRSINQAIRLAGTGDQILVGPGSYTPAEEGPAPGTCDLCLILVNKSVRIESTEGADVTVLDARFARNRVMEITAGSVTIDGLTLTRAVRDGVHIIEPTRKLSFRNNIVTENRDAMDIRGSGHVFEDNWIVRNTSDGFDIDESAVGLEFRGNRATGNNDDGFQVDGRDHTFHDNISEHNRDSGFLIRGPGHLFRGNRSTGNSEGFRVRTGGDRPPDGLRFVGNVATNNNIVGFSFEAGSGHVVRRNHALGNEGVGLFTRVDDALIIENNFYGNDAQAPSPENCGLLNFAGSIAAPMNYWGAPTGPGDDPADRPCGDEVAVAPVATDPFPMDGGKDLAPLFDPNAGQREAAEKPAPRRMKPRSPQAEERPRADADRH